MPTRLRRRYLIALVASLVFLAFVLGQADAGFATAVIRWCGAVMRAVGVPEVLTTPSRVELVLNLLMIVPPAMLVTLLYPRHPWANWVVYGFVAACLVEGFQGLVLPMRSAQYVDVVANTAGVLAGVLMARAVAFHLERGRTE